ncbi:hypothetical protein F2Q69_00010269 [Brassica cretica]|uniref:Uncharacterized protein n=1 Tax=Brassica cretica TaxID=69181 RepID=A0A8S9R1I8_BRACR|nr:hypothetical protein F2Q69_00010269 [Brassica cretica]
MVLRCDVAEWHWGLISYRAKKLCGLQSLIHLLLSSLDGETQSHDLVRRFHPAQRLTADFIPIKAYPTKSSRLFRRVETDQNSSADSNKSYSQPSESEDYGGDTVDSGYSETDDLIRQDQAELSYNVAEPVQYHPQPEVEFWIPADMLLWWSTSSSNISQ